MPVMSGANKIVGGDTSPAGLSSGGASTASTPLWRPARAVKIAIKCQPKSKKCWSSGQGGPSKDVSALTPTVSSGQELRVERTRQLMHVAEMSLTQASCCFAVSQSLIKFR